MKKRFFIGLLVMLFAFIIAPFQTKASAVDVDVGIEQSDIDFILPDAVQPEIYTVQAGSQVATPFIWPTESHNYTYTSDLNRMDCDNYMTAILSPNCDNEGIQSRTANIYQWNRDKNCPLYNSNQEGLYRLEIGEFN